MSYKDLRSYQQAEEIFDLTMRFCREFLSEKKDSRFRDQMEQAARSGKQNIVEGAEQHTDAKGYGYLLGIARGSLAELLEDFRDFARTHGFEAWQRGDERVEKVKKMDRQERLRFLLALISSSPSLTSIPSSPSTPSNSSLPTSFPSNPSHPSSPSKPSTPYFPSTSSHSSSPSLDLTLVLNYLIDLIIRTNYLLDRQKKSIEEKFAKDGGYSEQLRLARNDYKKAALIKRYYDPEEQIRIFEKYRKLRQEKGLE